jgi:hypothetical protein
VGHTPCGVVEFHPTCIGLHIFDLNGNPEAAYLLVNDTDLTYPTSPSSDDQPIPQDAQVHINTVYNNFEGYMKKQVKNAEPACRLICMVASPSEQDFQAMVHLNMLKDCPVTNNDIHAAYDIYGPDLAFIRRKTVRG